MVRFIDVEITSRKNDALKFAASLLTSKGRKKENAFRFDGIKLFCEAVRCGVCIDTVLIRSDAMEEILSRLDERCDGWREKLSAKVIPVKDGVFDAVSEENAPEGIICIAKYLDKSEKSGTIIRRDFFSSENSFNNMGNMSNADDTGNKHGTRRIMAAEAIRDPGNLGTIIRTCKAMGVDTLCLSSDCADILSSKVIRSSMGAVFALDVCECKDLCMALESMKEDGRRILATALYGESVPLSKMKLDACDVFVIGNEGHGLSNGVLSVADRCVYIDMYSGPGCESLNAGVAAAICAWEQKRQLCE